MLTCILLLLLTWSAHSISAAETPRAGGHDYVRLLDWAKANHLDLTWVKRDETLAANNSSTKLLFKMDSREAQLNGVQLLLLFPVTQRDGKILLSRLDVQTTLQPILSPPKPERGTRVRTICLDPGHGGKDPGYQVGANQEKKYALLTAQELRAQLEHAGFKVFLTRSSDSFVDLPERPALANRKGADLFISVHFNASPPSTSTKTIQGCEVYCLTPAGAESTNSQGEGGPTGPCPGNRNNDKNMFLAYQMQKNLTRRLGAEDRGVKRARYAVLRDATMPAILIETGFMSHPVEGKHIFDPAYRRQIAHAIVEGVQEYKRQVEGVKALKR